MMEQRLTERLTKYWNILKKELPIPPFEKFNSSAIDDLWGNCVLLTVNQQADKDATYTFYQMGDRVRNLYSGDLTGQTINPKHKMIKGAGIIQKVDTILQEKEPVYDQGQFVNHKNKVVKFRSCMLPFGLQGKVTHVVVGLSWKEF